LTGYDRKEILHCFMPDLHDEAQEGLLELERTTAYHARLRYPRSLMESTATAYLPDQILVKVDRTSMMISLESRAPFLDRSLVEYALRLPLRYNLEQGMGKAILRRALPDWVPPSIRWRDKRGFTPPMASWLRSTLRPQMEEILRRSETNSIFDLQPVRDKLQQHVAKADHADYLFRWFVLLRRWAHSADLSRSTAAQVAR
jgi:asparagine synthase (glutamine-hydrolysing)